MFDIAVRAYGGALDHPNPWFHKRARHKSETASPERKATTNQTSSHDKPTE
jgi:hypothetical protein